MSFTKQLSTYYMTESLSRPRSQDSLEKEPWLRLVTCLQNLGANKICVMGRPGQFVET